MRIWEGQMVVYDPYSGDTHCMDRLATAVLSRLAECGTATAKDLETHLRGLPDLAQDLETGDVPAGVLEELEKLGLVHHVTQ
jgi:PqqD family protein of HPr-rel-A system